MRISLIIPAAGASRRFAKGISFKKDKVKSHKLLAELYGDYVLSHALQAFSGIPEICEILIPASSAVRQALKRRPFPELSKIQLMTGGKTRAESVFHALSKASRRSNWVMVHDGARPLVNSTAIKKLIASAKRSRRASILASPIASTVKRVDSRGFVEETVDRSQLWQAETPQLIPKPLLKRAYARVKKMGPSFTDEASLLENIGEQVKVVLNDGWNPKITSKGDLNKAELFLRGSDAGSRIGLGFDIHRLEKGRTFWLGSVKLPFPKGPVGHSDGDALLHAVCDGVLGAMSWGDIGSWFSDRDPKYKNIRSSNMLKTILKKLNKEGLQVTQLDVNILLEKPNLSAYKEQIKMKVAELLNLNPERISIKAKTYESLGPIGTSDAVGCEALVVVGRSTMGGHSHLIFRGVTREI